MELSYPSLVHQFNIIFYAENDAAGKFLPVRAAHEYFTLTPEKGLVINEIAAKNETIAMDEYGDYDDWIEFYNNTDEVISLNGHTLSDDPDQPDKWVFPAVNIEPGGFLIVWADDDSLVTDDLHANFKLSAGGEILGLYNPAGNLADQVAFPDQFDDITWGRYENGTGEFDYLYPTFGAENNSPVGLTPTIVEQPLVYPNPATEYITIQYSQPLVTPIYVLNLNGQIVLTSEFKGQKSLDLDISSLAPGVYLILDQSMKSTKLIVK